MADNQEVYSLILKIEGAEKAADLKAQIALAEQKIASLWSTMKGQPAQFQSAIKDTAASLVELKTKLEAAEKAAAGLQGGSKNSGRALLEFSRAAEDAQYGVAGVVNNIPGLVSALGAGAGLVGVISLVVIAAAQLYKHWDDLANLFGQGKTLTEAEEMKKLGDQTKRTADEEERLQRLKNREKHDQAQHQEREADTAIGKQIDEAIREAPVKKVDEAIRVIYKDELKAKVDPALLKERDAARTDYEGANSLFNQGQMTGDQVASFKSSLDKAQKAVDDQIDEAVRSKRLDLNTLRDGKASNMESFMGELQRRPELGFGTGDLKKFKEATVDPKAKKEKDDEEKADAHAQQEENDYAYKLDKWQKEGEQKRIDDEEESAWQELQESSKQVHKKFEDRRNKEKDQQGKDKKQSTIARKRIDDDIEQNPFADAQIEHEFLRNMMGGASASKTSAIMEKQLKEHFMNKDIDLSEEDAAKMARDRLDEARQGVFAGVNQDGGQTHVETHQGAEAFLAAIQGGFSKDSSPNKGVEDRLEKIYDAIANDQNTQQTLIGQFG